MVRPMVDFAALFDASPNPYMVLDRDLRYVAANQAYLDVTSRTREELIGAYVADLFPHDPADPDNASKRLVLGSFERVLATGKPDVLPFIHYRIPIEGTHVERTWSATHTPIFDEAGRVAMILQHTVDVTDVASQRGPATQIEAGILGRAERAQQRSDALDQGLRRLLSLFEQAPGFLAFLSGPDHVFELANAAYEKLVGNRRVAGKKIRDALPELDSAYLRILDEVLATGRPFVGRGMSVWLQDAPDQPAREAIVDFMYQPILDVGGRTLGILVSGNDITEQARAMSERERLLREGRAAQAELEAIFESFPEALYVGDATGIKRANAAARDILGYDTIEQVQRRQPELVREVAARDAVTGAPIALDDTPYARALRGEASRCEVIITERRTRAERYIHSSGAPVRVGGEIIGAIVAHIDVTERKLAETEARVLAQVLEATRDFVGIARLDGTPTFVNGAGRALLGLPDLEAARRLPAVEYFAPRERARVAGEIVPAALRDGYWEGEMRFLHRVTGEEIPVLYNMFPLRDAAGAPTALATITRDLRHQHASDAERARLLESERAARAQAEHANLLKDQFLATISHELRTPLSAILGWMHMLRTGMLPADKRERALDSVERNAKVQAQLIEDLLDVSRIISNKLELEKEPTDLAAVVAAGVETVRPTAEGKGVRLAITLDFPCRILGDAHRLQQVVWNLLSNAVKFTPAGGLVALSVERSGDCVEIAVTDTGAGISAAFLPHVFERFRQAEGGSARKLGGLGLGLSIVRHVVEAHGGGVRATSDGPGTGATFTVRLPILRPAREEPRSDPALQLLREPPAALAGARVLVVDDDEDTRELVRMLLARCRVQVVVACDAAEAYGALQRERPDVLISDISMPGEDGYQLIQKVRALPADRGGRTSAVALTAYARSEDRTRALLAGFQNHVTKPIEPGELLAAVASLVTRAERA
jgi:PAS domain S-box-containing protein